MRVAARVAYWGPAYHGYARQPDLETVEGELIRALKRIGAIRDPDTARLAVASRTDRGVSAVANVVAFDTTLPPLKLPKLTSGRMHHAWLWSAVPALNTFNPRHAQRRTYRYHFPWDTSVPRLREAARVFQGEHDFASFTVGRIRGHLAIDRIRIRRDASFVHADFEAQRFARGLVRRLAGSMEAYARGDLGRSDLRGALAGGPLPASPASPEGLFLLDVDCGFEWPAAPDHTAEAVRGRLGANELALQFTQDVARRVSAHVVQTLPCPVRTPH